MSPREMIRVKVINSSFYHIIFQVEILLEFIATIIDINYKKTIW